MRLRLEVFGDVQVDRELLRFTGRLTDASPAFAQLADDFNRIEREQFKTEGGRSSKWVPIKAATRRAKIKRGLDPRILHATHRLRDSLTKPSGPDVVRKIRPDSLEVGSTVPYGVFHQRGTRTLPRRPPVDLTEGDRRRWVQVLQRFLVEGST